MRPDIDRRLQQCLGQALGPSHIAHEDTAGGLNDGLAVSRRRRGEARVGPIDDDLHTGFLPRLQFLLEASVHHDDRHSLVAGKQIMGHIGAVVGPEVHEAVDRVHCLDESPR